MKVLLVILLSAVGLTRAQDYSSFCTKSSDMYQVPYPTECSKFIQCIGNVGTVLTCLNDMWFDEFLLICRPQDVAQCQHLPSNDIPDYVIQYCNTLPVGQTIPAEACNKYYVCYGTRAFELTCPDGQHYSRAYSACMNPLKAGCRALNTMCFGKYPGFAFPSLTCENFYSCNTNLMPELQACDSGLYFSAKLQNCTSPALSGCVNEEPITSPTTTSTESSGGCDTTISPSAPVCNASNTGTFYPHPQCNWFYMCYNSVAQEFQCECGQYYDASLQYCVQDTNQVCLT